MSQAPQSKVSSSSHHQHKQDSGHSSAKDMAAKKNLSKEIQAKEEKQRLLAAMLKSSTQQTPNKPTYAVGGTKGSPQTPSKSATPAKPAPGKKSLFNFLNSL